MHSLRYLDQRVLQELIILMRSLSYTFQYFTLVGSIGYVAKQLYNSGFMEPIGLLPPTISNLSSLAYGDDFIVNNHTANVYSVTENC